LNIFVLYIFNEFVLKKEMYVHGSNLHILWMRKISQFRFHSSLFPIHHSQIILLFNTTWPRQLNRVSNKPEVNHMSECVCVRVLGLDSWQGLGIFLLTTMSRTALGPTQPPIQWVPGVLSLGVKWPCCEADHSPPSSAKVKGWVELYLHSPIRLHGVVLSYSTETTLCDWVVKSYFKIISQHMNTMALNRDSIVTVG
jgi:hypothetical protein